MTIPKVSVVIPTYNHREFILDTLDSVLNQTMSDYEVVVVNDGSPDDTHELLQPLVQANRVAYFQQANQGQSYARNVGISKARGEYIAFLDDDDIWPVDKLEWQVRMLDEDPSLGIIGGRFHAIDASGQFQWAGRYHPEINFETLFTENPFHSPGQVLIRADVLRRVGGLDSAIWGADDWDLWFRVAREFQIVMVDRVALYYRFHPSNASKQTARLLDGCCQTIERHLESIAPSKRSELRTRSQRTIYSGLGSKLVSAARRDLKRGRVIDSMKELAGLLPLRQGILFDAQVRSRFLRDFVYG